MFTTHNPINNADPLSAGVALQTPATASNGLTTQSDRTSLNHSSVPLIDSGNGLRADYYNGDDFNNLRLTCTDSTVNFWWNMRAPDPSVNVDHFSVRWTGQVQPEFSETYTFYTSSDDGVRLWVNAQKLIDNWTVHPLTENEGTITLQAGKKYDIKLEYYENQGAAASKLMWSSPHQGKEVIPQSQLFSNLLVANIKPTLSLPSIQSMTTGSSLAIKDIRVTDPDARNGKLTVTLNAAFGTLKLNGNISGGVPTTGISNNSTGRVVLNGTLQQINTTLANAAGLTYQPNSGFQGTDTIKVSVNDNGNSGAGGALVDQKSFQVNVTPVQNPTGGSQGQFTLRGHKIFDPMGNEFIAKGTNMNGYNAYWGRETTQDLDEVVDAWHFNTIRLGVNLHIGEATWNGKVMPQYSTNNDLGKIIDAYTKRGVVVMLVLSDRSPWNKDDPLINNWVKENAAKYKNNPYVWFDTYNEPGPTIPTQKSLDEWVNYNRKIIKMIRDQGNNNVVLVEGTAWGQDAGNWNSNPVPTQDSSILQAGDRVRQGFQNVGFSIHVYDQWREGDARLADYIDRVQAKGFPLVVGETGPSNAGLDCMEAVRSLYRVGPQKGIGIVNFEFPGGDGNILAAASGTSGGWTINSFTNPTNLTEFGKIVWADSHSPSYIGPKPYSALNPTSK